MEMKREIFIPYPLSEQLLRIAYESEKSIEEIVENALIHHLERNYDNG